MDAEHGGAFRRSHEPRPGERIREAVRAVVLDPEDRVLMVRFELPERSAEWGRFWALPGGGLSSGESDHDGLRRELAEEVGLLDPLIGPHIWNRTHRFMFDSAKFDIQVERFYLVQTPVFDPQPLIGWERMRAEYVHEIRWFSQTDLALLDARIAPAMLPTLMALLVDAGPGPEVVDAGL